MGILGPTVLELLLHLAETQDHMEVLELGLATLVGPVVLVALEAPLVPAVPSALAPLLVP